MRQRKGLEMIEEIAANAQTTAPKRDWKESQEAVCKIYEIIHSLRAPRCRKNHPGWGKAIDAAIRAEMRGK
jgi:hypothetical protein